MPREQFQRGLRAVEDGVLDLGAMIERQMGRAMQALVDDDLPLADAVVRDDGEVNRTRFHLDNMCVSLLAQQAPLASDLRLIVAVLSIVSDLERMGDHAEGIARIVRLRHTEPPMTPLPEIPEMAEHASAMLRSAMDAFVRRSVEGAYAVGRADDEVDALYDRVYRQLVAVMARDARTTEACTHLLWVAHNLERIADRSTNIAERVVFLVTGMLPDMEASRP
jgi:phosphate transport system protein